VSIAIPQKLPMAKAGPLGPGAGVLLTEFPLAKYGKQTPQTKMQRAWTLSFEVPWIAAAEDAITERFSNADWHLEDENDEPIDDAYPNADAQAARSLLEFPSKAMTVGAPYYRSDLWGLTARAMGVCGSGFILLDQPESLANTPAAMLPIAPWRFTPQEDPSSNLIGWWIDRTSSNPGIAVRMDQVLHYKLRPSFDSHFGVGLVESALRKAQITTGLDDHVGMVLSGGGRLSGLLSPSSGVMDPDIMVQMERDWRTVVEQSDAAKRLQLVRAPIKFDRTTLTPAELQVRDLMVGSRDDLLTLWGVPLSIIGGSTPAGLNSGDTRKYDEAAIWQGPIHHRLNVFREVTQYQLLDRYAARGAVVELEIDEPEFDDDSPRYDLLGKSLNTPMTNMERRALIGLEPLGDPMLDLAIILPATIVPYASAPAEAEQGPTAVTLGRAPQAQLNSGDPAMMAAGEDTRPAAKAAIGQRLHPRIAPLHAALVRIRTNTADKVTPRLKTSVADVLKQQQHDIAERLRKHADHVTRHPTDSTIWWDKGWDAKMTRALAPHLTVMAEAVVAQVQDVLPSRKAGPVGAVERTLARGAARVTGINETTRAKIADAVARGIDEGLSVLEVADLIENGGDIEGLDMGSLFDPYRAEMIARTELMDAYNGAALGSYGDAGVEMVEAIDGDEDEECIARLAGNPYTIDEADAEEDHPNGTLDWVPLMPEEAKATFRSHDLRDRMHAIADSVPDLVVHVSPPQVNVAAPTVNVEAPTVNVPAPVVNVAAPNVIVTPAPVPKPTRKVVHRDDEGRISGVSEE
jgi:hypothetical protein